MLTSCPHLRIYLVSLFSVLLCVPPEIDAEERICMQTVHLGGTGSRVLEEAHDAWEN